MTIARTLGQRAPNAFQEYSVPFKFLKVLLWKARVSVSPRTRSARSDSGNAGYAAVETKQSSLKKKSKKSAAGKEVDFYFFDGAV